MTDPLFTFPFDDMDQCDPADAASAGAFDALALNSDCFTVVAHHERTIRQPPPSLGQAGLFEMPGTDQVAVTETAAILHDTSAMFDIPGTADLVAVHLHRHPGAARFRLRTERVPTMALAHRWLAQQGFPPDALTVADSLRQAAHPISRTAEQRIAADREGRYQVVDHYTHENGPVYVLYHDQRPGTLPPYLAHAEIPEPGDSPWSYRIREARFASIHDANAWHLDDFPATRASARPGATRAPRPSTAPPRRPHRR